MSFVRTLLRVGVVLIVTAFFLTVFGPVALAALRDQPVGPDDPSACRSGNVLAGVQDPGRLHVISRCVTARGTVAVVQNAEDGDWHIGLVPDPGSLRLIDGGNVRHMGGMLVVEVIPRDQAAIRRPEVGDRIAVTGAYVLDAPRGWREVHPAWRVETRMKSPLPAGVQARWLAFLQRIQGVVEPE